MKILITGSARGIGRAVALRFLEKGHTVVGLDRDAQNTIEDPHYTHHVCDITCPEQLPVLSDIEAIFHNAGCQNSSDDIRNNLSGTINVNEKYGYGPRIKAILFNASASAVSGAEFPLYAASKAGLIGYMKNTAIKLAPREITVNAISLGGVITESNRSVMEDPTLWDRIMEVTPLKKWMTLEEVADWVEFLILKNRSMSGENILIDNGEYKLRDTFVWPGD